MEEYKQQASENQNRISLRAQNLKSNLPAQNNLGKKFLSIQPSEVDQNELNDFWKTDTDNNAKDALTKPSINDIIQSGNLWITEHEKLKDKRKPEQPATQLPQNELQIDEEQDVELPSKSVLKEAPNMYYQQGLGRNNHQMSMENPRVNNKLKL